MKRYLAVLLASILCTAFLTSCALTDPLGATTRTQIRAAGAVQIAEAQAHAQIESARYAAEAQEATARTWADTLPVLLLILVGGALAGLICYFRGRVYLLWAERGCYPPTPLASTPHARRLADYARQTGQRLELVNGQYYLVDQQSGRRFKALPKL
jgi:hypothetical protein